MGGAQLLGHMTLNSLGLHFISSFFSKLHRMECCVMLPYVR